MIRVKTETEKSTIDWASNFPRFRLLPVNSPVELTRMRKI